jgi:hypothetical protein
LFFPAFSDRLELRRRSHCNQQTRFHGEIGPEWNLSILNLSLLIGSKVPQINEERLDEISLALLYPATAG